MQNAQRLYTTNTTKTVSLIFDKPLCNVYWLWPNTSQFNTKLLCYFLVLKASRRFRERSFWKLDKKVFLWKSKVRPKRIAMTSGFCRLTTVKNKNWWSYFSIYPFFAYRSRTHNTLFKILTQRDGDSDRNARENNALS